MEGEKRATVCFPDRRHYRHWTSVTLRYGDTDKQGHVNNAVYCTLFESGRIDFLLDENDPDLTVRQYVIAKITLDYLTELNFPGVAEVGSVIMSIGRTSFTVGQGIFMGQACHSTAESVIVLIDPQTKRPSPIDDELRQKLEKLARI